MTGDDRLDGGTRTTGVSQRSEGGRRRSPVGVDLWKKPKDLSEHESDECGDGKGSGVCMILYFS